jgi:hypothetical protein
VIGVELGCLGVIAFYLGARARTGDLAAFARKAAILATAAWIGEDTCIHAYGFYGYSPAWHGAIDRVPVLVAVIWPLVILSADTLSRALAPRASAGARAVIAGGLVVLDAAFIEPASVQAGLWSWTVPGVFGVPLIGILGWGLFAGSALYALERLPPRASLGVLAIAPLATHAMLLAGWWGLFRWLPRPLPDLGALAVVAPASIALTVTVARTGARVPKTEMVCRLVAATFFFVLLALYARNVGVLVAYAAAFAPPYFMLMFASFRAPRAAAPA